MWFGCVLFIGIGLTTPIIFLLSNHAAKKEILYTNSFERSARGSLESWMATEERSLQEELAGQMVCSYNGRTLLLQRPLCKFSHVWHCILTVNYSTLAA